jgi:hypothetical protein
MDADIRGVWVSTQEYRVMQRLVDEVLALLRRAKIWFCCPDVWKMVPFHPKKLRFVGVIDLHNPQPTLEVDTFAMIKTVICEQSYPSNYP